MKRIIAYELSTTGVTPYALSFSIDRLAKELVKELVRELKAHLRANGSGQTYEIKIMLNVKESNVSE